MTFIIFRRAALDDLDVLVDLRLKLLHETGDLQHDEPSSELIEVTRTYLHDQLFSERFHSWVALAEGRVVAISGLLFFQKPPTEQDLIGLEVYIMNMYTLPEWRGQGIATALMQEIITYVKQTPARRIWLRTTQDGKKVYERCGFVFTDSTMELMW